MNDNNERVLSDEDIWRAADRIADEYEFKGALLTTRTIYARAIEAAVFAKLRAGAEPVAWMQDDGSLHTTRDSAYFRGGIVRPLCDCAAPAPVQGAVDAKLLSLFDPKDIDGLKRFHECCEDFEADGHDVKKERMKNMEKVGLVRSLGFGRHETTTVGDYILELLSSTQETGR